MTVAPAPHVPQAARLNAGPYPVRVSGFIVSSGRQFLGRNFKKRITEAFDSVSDDFPMSQGLSAEHFTLEGTAQADGTLDLPRERWAARHYRRAVMAGAGVYLTGLWARLQPGRSAQVLDLDPPAVPQNDAGTLARFLPPAPPVITVDLQAGGGLTMRQIEKAPKHMREGLTSQFNETVRRTLAALWDNVPVSSGYGTRYAAYVAEMMGEPFSPPPAHSWQVSSILGEYIAGATKALKSELTRSGLSDTEARQLLQVIAEARKLQRALRRLLLAQFKRAPRPPACKLPPPLYCLPRPPAAPQAPPALQ